MLPVVWVCIRQGLPCTTMKQGGVIRQGRIGSNSCEDWREKLKLPAEKELEPISPYVGREQLEEVSKLPPGLPPPYQPAE